VDEGKTPPDSLVAPNAGDDTESLAIAGAQGDRDDGGGAGDRAGTASGELAQTPPRVDEADEPAPRAARPRRSELPASVASRDGLGPAAPEARRRQRSRAPDIEDRLAVKPRPRELRSPEESSARARSPELAEPLRAAKPPLRTAKEPARRDGAEAAKPRAAAAPPPPVAATSRARRAGATDVERSGARAVSSRPAGAEVPGDAWSPLDAGSSWPFDDAPNTPNVVDRGRSAPPTPPREATTASPTSNKGVRPAAAPTLPLTADAIDPATDFASAEIESARRSAMPDFASEIPEPRPTVLSVVPPTREDEVPSRDREVPEKNRDSVDDDALVAAKERGRDGEQSNPPGARPLDEDDFNPFALGGEDDGETRGPSSGRQSSAPWDGPSGLEAMGAPSFESFLEGPAESVPTGLHAMLQNRSSESALGSLRAGSRTSGLDDAASDWTPASKGSLAPFDDDDAAASSRPKARSFEPESERTPAGSSSFRSSIADSAPPSVFELPAAPSLSALDIALGNVLGSQLDSALEQGAGNMASQLEALLKEDRQSLMPGPEADFGRLSDEFSLAELREAHLASKIPPPADTLRGAIPGESELPTGMRGGDGGWSGIPGQVDLRRIGRAVDDEEPTDDDSDGLWAPSDADDYVEPKVRRGTSDRTRPSEPPEWDTAPSRDADLEEAPPSDWGTLPPPAPPGKQKKSIPNYEEQLNALKRTSLPPTPASKPATESERPVPLPSLPPAESRPPRPRTSNRGIWLAAAFVLLAVALTLLPWYLLVRAEKRATACFRDVVATTEGDPEACRPSTGELALARNLPWLEEDARRVKEWSDFKAARLAYDKATAVVPNATRSSEAAQRLLDLTYRGTSSERTAALGVVAGSHAAVTRFAIANREPEAVSFALRSARALGSLDGMRVLASSGGADDPFGMSLRRGALLCLLGDANEGARAFVQADIAHQRLNTTMEGHHLARLGLVACGKPQGVNGEIDAHAVSDLVVPAMAALEASLETQEGFAAAKSFLDTGKQKVGGIQRLRIAPWVIRETKPSALESLRLLAPQNALAAKLDLISLRTPWAMLDVEAPVQAVYMDPQAAEAAASYLLKLADRVGNKPIDCSGEECPDDAAVKVPQAVLSEAARMFWLEAAAEHARLGRREAALEATAKVSQMTAKQRRHILAPIHLAVGDGEGALRALGHALEHLDQYNGTGQLRIHLNQALALAHLGRYDQAMAAAEKAFYTAEKAEEELRGTTDAALDEEVALQDDRVSAAWLWSAMSLLAGKPERISDALRDFRTQEFADVVAWTRLAAQPEEARRANRWELSLATMSESALPAVMYVVSRAVPSMTDVEVWLDRVFQQEHRTQPTRAMLARAEIARWRNDPEAERTWHGRAAKLHGLVKDYKTSLLAHILELR